MRESCAHHPHVSVVVCTRGVRPSLRECLDSLVGQGCSRREILVVLNGHWNERFSRLVENYPIRILIEPRQGVSVARNCALRHVEGEILAFVDDDVVAGPGWLHEIVRGFEEPSVACVTGRVVPRGRIPYPKEFADVTYRSEAARSFWKLTSSEDNWYEKLLTWPMYGCNMAFRGEFLQQHSRFPTRLGAGSVIGGHDDTWIFLQVLRQGFQITHTPLAFVTHTFTEDETEQRSRAKEVSAAHVAFMLALMCEEKGHRMATAKLFLEGLRRYIRSFFHSNGGQPGSEGVLSPKEKLLPLISGPLVYWRSLRSRD